MHQSLRSALPALRPVSPANLETPRDSFSKVNVVANSRFSSDFEVNRSLFVQDFKQKILPPAKAKQAPRTVPPTLEKVSLESKSPEKIKKMTQLQQLPQKQEQVQEQIQEQPPSEEVKDAPTTNPYLKQVQDLFERIPTGKEPIPLDEVYRLSPILDRVLCVVSEWKPEFIIKNLDHPIICELQQRLFNLIDIDDFLIRTIICRILLSFSTDTSSPLLLPISRIFYKLSCDQTNDHFFEEEQLVPILMSLIRIAQPDARVFAAGALRNIAACEEIRTNLLKTDDFLSLVGEIFDDHKIVDQQNRQQDDALRAQMIGAVKQMCKNEEFKKKLVATKFLSIAAKDNVLFIEVVRIVCMVNDLSHEEKLNFIELSTVSDLSDAISRRVVTRSLVVLSVDMENTPQLTNLVLKLIALTKDEPELLYFLLAVAHRCAETQANAKILQKEDCYFVNLITNKENSFDTNICVEAYFIVKLFNDEKYAQILSDHSLLSEINQSK